MAQQQYGELHQQVKKLLQEDTDFLRPIVEAVVQEALEAEMERVPGCRALRAYFQPARLSQRSLLAHAGDAGGRDRPAGAAGLGWAASAPRSSTATRLGEGPRVGDGGDVRQARLQPQGAWVHSFSVSAISRINKTRDAELAAFASRPLEEEYPHLILDARYEKVRENGVVRSQTVLTSFYRLPRRHHKQLNSTDCLERVNQEIKRRTWRMRSS